MLDFNLSVVYFLHQKEKIKGHLVLWAVLSRRLCPMGLNKVPNTWNMSVKFCHQRSKHTYPNSRFHTLVYLICPLAPESKPYFGGVGVWRSDFLRLRLPLRFSWVTSLPDCFSDRGEEKQNAFSKVLDWVKKETKLRVAILLTVVSQSQGLTTIKMWKRERKKTQNFPGHFKTSFLCCKSANKPWNGGATEGGGHASWAIHQGRSCGIISLDSGISGLSESDFITKVRNQGRQILITFDIRRW